MHSFGYNRPDFPGYLGKSGSNVCENSRFNQVSKPGRAGEMKIQVDVTPEETRTLLGLPDVKPMQKAMMEDIQGRMKKTLSAMEPESLFKMWLPAGPQNLEAWQKLFANGLGAAMGRKDEEGS
jgi:hypothetical protein